jgi:hypothetical protein
MSLHTGDAVPPTRVQPESEARRSLSDPDVTSESKRRLIADEGVTRSASDSSKQRMSAETEEREREAWVDRMVSDELRDLTATVYRSMGESE